MSYVLRSVVDSVVSAVGSFCRPSQDPSEELPRSSPDPSSGSTRLRYRDGGSPAQRRPEIVPLNEPALLPGSASQLTPDELSVALATTISQRPVLRSILASLPGVDPDDPRFEQFYGGTGAASPHRP
jgi:hypothetical protein